MSNELNFSGFDPKSPKYYPDGNFNVNTYNTLYNRGKYYPMRRAYSMLDAFSIQEDSVFQQDIAQARFFTITISSIADANGRPIVFSAGSDQETGTITYKAFLPVKNISVNFTDYENLSIPLGSLSNIPLLQKRKISNIAISCYDTDTDLIERALVAWENRCFPHGKYTAYLDSPGVTAEFEYKSYNVKGKLNYTRKLLVIPSGGISVNRGYDENSPKLLSFSVASVGLVGETYDSSGVGKTIWGPNISEDLAVTTQVNPDTSITKTPKNKK